VKTVPASAPNVDSSFFRLFRRSRYSRCDIDDLAAKQNRRELFAVAAVAFVIKHDPQFAKDFLTRVAGVPQEALRNNFVVQPQAEDHADLLICDHTAQRHYIVEFKVHAPPEDKQLPITAKFWRPRLGYGWQMIQRCQPHGAESVAYTLLSKHVEFEDSRRNGFEFRSRTWKELIPTDCTSESSLVKDLLDTLGDFGIPALRLRNVRNMKNAQYVKGTFQIHELLEAVLSEFGHPSLEVSSDDTYTWCGMSLLRLKNEDRVLRAWVGHNWARFGWIGYLIPKDPPDQPELSVWLYFDRTRAKHRDISIRQLKKVLPTQRVRAAPKETDLLVTEAADKVSDEREWFSHVLDMVLRQSVPDSFRRQKRKGFASRVSL
jgi:hypothetical protein